MQPPAAVQLASDAYRAANDPLAGFLADCTVEADPEDWVLAREAFKAYTRWADREELGKQQLGRNQFGERLAFRFPPGPRRNGQTVRGLKLVEV